MDLGLKDKVAIVTGGASGIGEAIVRVLAEEGAKPIILDKNREKADALAQELVAEGHHITVHILDLRRENACQDVVEEIIETYGSIDILINNAGVNDSVDLDRPMKDFVESLEKNLYHVVTMTRLCVPHLRYSKGAIVNIGSKVSVTGQGNTTGYAAAKGAIHALTREWAVRLLKDGIRINEVLPAETWTPLYEQWINSMPDGQERLKEIVARIPLGKRMTTSREIADTVVFLASDRASHITGQQIFVDGGYTHLDRAIR